MEDGGVPPPPQRGEHLRVLLHKWWICGGSSPFSHKLDLHFPLRSWEHFCKPGDSSQPGDNEPLSRDPSVMRVGRNLFFFEGLFIFRQRGREGEREGEKHQCVVALCPAPGNLAGNPGLCPDWESTSDSLVLRPALSPLSHTSQSRGAGILKHNG